jgi:hypothetical protein
MKIKGHVTAVLKDKNGKVIQVVEGPNAVVQMSNNILMDAIYPRLLDTDNTTLLAAAERPEGSNMTDNTTFPTGADVIGPAALAGASRQVFAYNQVAFLAVGSNVGSDSAGNAHLIAAQNTDVANPNQQVSMVDSNFIANIDNVAGVDTEVFVRRISAVTFPAYNQMRFTTTFGTTEGNITNGIAEIALWTLGNNGSTDGEVTTTTQPTTSVGMRMFARKVLANTISKSDDGTLDITYTLTFGA